MSWSAVDLAEKNEAGQRVIDLDSWAPLYPDSFYGMTQPFANTRKLCFAPVVHHGTVLYTAGQVTVQDDETAYITPLGVTLTKQKQAHETWQPIEEGDLVIADGKTWQVARNRHTGMRHPELVRSSIEV